MPKREVKPLLVTCTARQRFVQVAFREKWKLHLEWRRERNTTDDGTGLKISRDDQHGSHLDYLHRIGLVGPVTESAKLSETDAVGSDDGQPSAQVQFKNF